MDGPLLTTGEAAQRLGVAKGTLLRAVRRHDIVAAVRTPGGYLRFRPDEVESYARRFMAAASQAVDDREPSLDPDRRVALAESRFDALVAAATHIVWLAHASGHANGDLPYWRAYTGQSASEVERLGWLDAVHPDERERVAQAWTRSVAAGTPYEDSFRLRRADGEYRSFLARAAPVYARDDGCVAEWVGVCMDLTAQDHTAADLHATVEAALDAIITINHAGRIVAFNPAAERIFGYQRGAVLGQELGDLIIPPDQRRQHCAGLARYLASGEGTLLGRRVEVTAMRADGSLFPAELAITRIPLDGPAHFTGYIRDITERVRMVEALQHQALHDALTDLPNRTLLHDRLQHALAIAQRDHQPLALLLLDLDRFKEVNDAFGHQVGDWFLQQIAVRLRGVLRDADTPARLGGDEFAVLLPGNDAAGAAVAARKVLAVLDDPVIYEGQALPGAASIGIAVFPEHGADAQTLLRRADVAMYAAKRTHRPYATYMPAHDPYSPSRLDLIAGLRAAIAHGELRLHYQPKVELGNGRVQGVEALMRWQHPQHGLIAPDLFIPLAEQTGLIESLTRWALEAALQQGQRWRRRGLELGVAVNLSMWNVHDPQLPETVARLLQGSALPPSALRVELTETAIMADADRALDVLTRLSALGVHVSVDDFGTGYSSLAYLKRLPVDEIKIDKSFVQQMAHDSNDAAIVASTIGLGRGLGLRIVAEGVEDRQTWDLLAEMDCDAAQGYYMSRPLPAPGLSRWLHATENRATSSYAAN